MTLASLAPVLQQDGLLDIDPVLLAIVAVMLLFIFFVYLFIRKTVTGFKEGMDESKRRR
jgi:ABC-type uncharacterized transport system permease subunit